jgi:hypothetical protein
MGKRGIAKNEVLGTMRDVPTDRRDRVMAWQEELLRIAPHLYDLPAAARQAVYDTVNDFLHEDAEGVQSPLFASAA